MEPDTVTVDDCCESAGSASHHFGGNAPIGSILITNIPEWLERETLAAAINEDRHKSLINSVPSNVSIAGAVGFIPHGRLGGMHNRPSLPIAGSIPSSFDLCLGKVEVKGEVASRVAGGPFAVPAVLVEGLPRPSRMNFWKCGCLKA